MRGRVWVRVWGGLRVVVVELVEVVAGLEVVVVGLRVVVQLMLEDW